MRLETQQYNNVNTVSHVYTTLLFTACAAECRSNGSGQCILSGCCPFFESDGEGCVDQCGPNQQPDQEFICQGTFS